MMKLGAAWYGFREQTPANYFEMAAALGLNYVEIPLYEQVIKHKGFRYSRKGVEVMRALAERAGVRMVSSVSADVRNGSRGHSWCSAVSLGSSTLLSAPLAPRLNIFGPLFFQSLSRDSLGARAPVKE